MPMNYYIRFSEGDIRRWEVCLRKAESQMLTEGWHPKARKFHEVRRRRALKLWKA